TQVAFGLRSLRTCRPFDGNNDGRVTIDELVQGTAQAYGRPEGSRTGPETTANDLLAAVPTLSVGTATGAAGQEVAFAVALTWAGASVAGTQNDITFDSVNTPVAATGTRRPDCTAGGAFRPVGCTGTGCTAIRELVIDANLHP